MPLDGLKIHNEAQPLSNFEGRKHGKLATTVQYWTIRRGGEPPLYLFFDQACKQEFDVRDTRCQVEQDRTGPT
jgi:hypothetical protein